MRTPLLLDTTVLSNFVKVGRFDLRHRPTRERGTISIPFQALRLYSLLPLDKPRGAPL